MTLSFNTARDHLPAAMEAARTEAVFLERCGGPAGINPEPSPEPSPAAAMTARPVGVPIRRPADCKDSVTRSRLLELSAQR